MSDTNGSAPKLSGEALLESLKGIRVDEGKFKLWEIEDLEETLGYPVAEYFNSPAPPMRFMRGLLWLRLRRQHSHVSFDDLRDIDLDTLEAAFGGGRVDPTPDGEPSSSPTSATSGA